MEYTLQKTNISKNNLAYMHVFFENGDYVTIDGSELVSISVDVYDKLARHNCAFYEIAASGCIELNVAERNNAKHDSGFVYDPWEYGSNRKEYIKRRLLSESVVTGIWFYDKRDRRFELHGNFFAEADGENVKIAVLPQPQMGDASSDKHMIMLEEIRKKDLCCVDFDFENGESFMVFGDEIKWINLIFDKNLVLCPGGICRYLVGGSIRLKINKHILPRAFRIYDEGRLKRKIFERRLCKKKGSSPHDIRQLTLTFDHAGSAGTLDERIEVDRFKSGYAKKLKDRTIILTFGSDAKKLMKELCKHKI